MDKALAGRAQSVCLKLADVAELRVSPTDRQQIGIDSQLEKVGGRVEVGRRRGVARRRGVNAAQTSIRH